MKIAVINLHPRRNSLCDALTEAYSNGAASAGASIKLIRVRDLEFDALVDPTTVEVQEPHLKTSEEIILWCQHLCVLFPTWWTGLPALGKGFIDRVFRSGFAFEYGKSFPKPLLKGRSARIIHTMAAPVVYNRMMLGQPQVRMMREGTLGFCGFDPVSVSAFGGIRPGGKYADCLKRVAKAGEADARTLRGR